MGPWGMSILGRENSQYKGPEVGACLAWLSKSMEAGVAGVEYVCVLGGRGGKQERSQRWGKADRALLSMRRFWVISLVGWEPWEGSEQRRDRT